MEPHNLFLNVIRNLAATLDPAGIAWAVTGAVAANQYRDQVRTTSDMDVLISLTTQDAKTVASVLHENGWQTVEVIEDWLIRADHPNAGRLDVLIAQTEYESLAIARAKHIKIDADLTYRTLSIEDVLLLKLIADRYQDNADVVSIFLTYPDLDWDYMSRWLNEFNLYERLNRIEAHAISRGELSKPISRNNNPP